MSDFELKAAPARRPGKMAAGILAAAAVSLLSGCVFAKRDSITVGAVPDDYRTNHPIMISEKETVVDIPVGGSERGITDSQRTAMEGFLSGYDRSAGPVLTIMAPAGSANEVAASHVARDLVHVARQNGINGSAIVITSYQAGSAEVSAPVRVSYNGVKAHTDKCGRWPEDVLKDDENKHYANFGCSYQNNLAAQIANPSDLLGPRKETTIDAENRSVVIDEYRNREVIFEPETGF